MCCGLARLEKGYCKKFDGLQNVFDDESFRIWLFGGNLNI